MRAITYQPRFAPNAVDSPNHRFVVLSFGNPWASVIVNRWEDVEHGKDTCNGETQQADYQVTPWANPVGGEGMLKRLIDGMWTLVPAT